MSQWRFISCKRCTLLGGVLTVSEVVRVWARGVYGRSLYSCSFYSEPETALKIKGHSEEKRRDRKELCGVVGVFHILAG